MASKTEPIRPSNTELPPDERDTADYPQIRWPNPVLGATGLSANDGGPAPDRADRRIWPDRSR